MKCILRKDMIKLIYNERQTLIHERIKSQVWTNRALSSISKSPKSPEQDEPSACGPWYWYGSMRGLVRLRWSALPWFERLRVMRPIIYGVPYDNVDGFACRLLRYSSHLAKTHFHMVSSRPWDDIPRWVFQSEKLFAYRWQNKMLLLVFLRAVL